MIQNIINIKSSVDNKVPISYAHKIKNKKFFHHSAMFKTVSPNASNTPGIMTPTTPFSDNEDQ